MIDGSVRINPEVFTSDKRILRIMEKLGKLTLREILIYLESFTYLTNGKIISVLKEQWDFPESMEYIQSPLPISELPSELISIKDFKVCPITFFNNKVSLAYDATSELNTAHIENVYSKYTFTYIPVTPYNYCQLTMTVDDIVDTFIDSESMIYRLAYEGYVKQGTDIKIAVTHVVGQPVAKTLVKTQNGYREVEVFPITVKKVDEICVTAASLAGRAVKDIDSSSGLQATIDDIFGDTTLSLRTVVMKTVVGYYMNCRLIKRAYTSRTVEGLGFDNASITELQFQQKRKNGAVFFGGPTGSGKSTTMYAMTNSVVNDRGLGEKNVLEIGSPIEVLMDWVQVVYDGSPEQMHAKNVILKKSDPEVVLITEIADATTASDVLDIINSDPLVMSSLHIGRVAEFPMKIYNYFKDEYKSLMMKTNIVIVQFKVVENCPHCLSTVAITSETNISKYQRRFCAENEITSYSIGTGCDFCNRTGLKQQMQPYLEMVVFTRELKGRLLRARDYIEMIDILEEELKIQGHSIENKLINGIKNNTLNLECLNLIL